MAYRNDPYFNPDGAVKRWSPGRPVSRSELVSTSKLLYRDDSYSPWGKYEGPEKVFFNRPVSGPATPTSVDAGSIRVPSSGGQKSSGNLSGTAGDADPGNSSSSSYFSSSDSEGEDEGQAANGETRKRRRDDNDDGTIDGNDVQTRPRKRRRKHAKWCLAQNCGWIFACYDFWSRALCATPETADAEHADGKNRLAREARSKLEKYRCIQRQLTRHPNYIRVRGQKVLAADAGFRVQPHSGSGSGSGEFDPGEVQPPQQHLPRGDPPASLKVESSTPPLAADQKAQTQRPTGHYSRLSPPNQQPPPLPPHGEDNDKSTRPSGGTRSVAFALTPTRTRPGGHTIHLPDGTAWTTGPSILQQPMPSVSGDVFASVYPRRDEHGRLVDGHGRIPYHLFGPDPTRPARSGVWDRPPRSKTQKRQLSIGNGEPQGQKMVEKYQRPVQQPSTPRTPSGTASTAVGTRTASGMNGTMTAADSTTNPPSTSTTQGNVFLAAAQKSGVKIGKPPATSLATNPFAAAGSQGGNISVVNPFSAVDQVSQYNVSTIGTSLFGHITSGGVPMLDPEEREAKRELAFLNDQSRPPVFGIQAPVFGDAMMPIGPSVQTADPVMSLDDRTPTAAPGTFPGQQPLQEPNMSERMPSKTPYSKKIGKQPVLPRKYRLPPGWDDEDDEDSPVEPYTPPVEPPLNPPSISTVPNHFLGIDDEDYTWENSLLQKLGLVSAPAAAGDEEDPLSPNDFVIRGTPTGPLGLPLAPDMVLPSDMLPAPSPSNIPYAPGDHFTFNPPRRCRINNACPEVFGSLRALREHEATHDYFMSGGAGEGGPIDPVTREPYPLLVAEADRLRQEGAMRRQIQCDSTAEQQTIWESLQTAWEMQREAQRGLGVDDFGAQEMTNEELEQYLETIVEEE